MSSLLTTLVIGVGNRWRGDDGIGPRTIEALARIDDLDTDLVTLDGEPARLVSAWHGRQLVVIVDAVVAGAAPGTVHVVTDTSQLPDPIGGASSHGGGITEAVALGRALGRLPDRLVVVGVEPATVDHGDELSPPVAAAVDAVVAAVVGLIERRRWPHVPERRRSRRRRRCAAALGVGRPRRPHRVGVDGDARSRRRATRPRRVARRPHRIRRRAPQRRRGNRDPASPTGVDHDQHHRPPRPGPAARPATSATSATPASRSPA